MTTKKKGLLRMKEINDAMPTPFVTEDSARTSSTEMRITESHYEEMFENLLEGVGIVDGEGNILFANEKLARILGCEVAEILKENISAVVIPSQKSQLERLRRTCHRGTRRLTEMELLRRDASPVRTLISIIPLCGDPDKKDAVMILVLDITKRKRIEEDLAQAEKKYRNIFENSVDGLFQSNSRDELISANPAMAHIFGYSSTSEFITAVNSRKQTLYADSKYDRKLKSLLRRQDSVYNFEFRAVQRLGKQIWINENIHSVRDERGNLLYYEGTLQDITEKKHLENELFQSKKMEAIGRIAGGIAHDFNNILTAIMGNAAMGERCLDPRSSAAKRIQAIKDAADQAGQLTRQLLSISRKQKVHPVLMNLNSSVISVGKILERILGEDIDLNVALNENLKSIYADPSQIEQVILNLSVNARDAMNQGGRLSISTENINLNQEFCRNHPDAVPGEYVRLSVSDTGTGIPKESLGYIFEPFYTTKKTGTGFGLSIVYSVIKRYAGHIEIDTAVRNGTKFSIYLPAVSGIPKIPRTCSVTEGMTIPTGKTILIVEDEETIREVLSEILQEMGCKTFSAPTAEEALERFHHFGEPIDLLITDVILPGKRGPEMAEELKIFQPDMNILYMSGYPLEKFHSTEIDVAPVSFIAKPFTPAMILDKLRQIFSQKEFKMPVS